MDNPAKSATAVKDPVCGMTVHPASARYRLEHAGKTHYFCSNHCVEKFKADPEKYLNQPAQFGSPSLVMLGGQPASTHAPAAAKVKIRFAAWTETPPRPNTSSITREI